MGGCCSNQLEEGYKEACNKADLKLFQKVFDDAKARGDALDWFKVFQDPERRWKQDDFISFFFKNIGWRTNQLTPFLKIMKEQILYNRNRKDNKAFAPFSNNFDYFDLFVELQSKSKEDAAALLLEAFRFFLDCRTDNVFPEKSFPNDGSFSSAFTRLCSSKRFTGHIRHMISSGLVDARFKNSNDSKTMKKDCDEDMLLSDPRAVIMQTPLEAACSKFCVDIVKELCVSHYGGTNYGDAVSAMLSGEMHRKMKRTMEYNAELDTKATEILLILLSQPGAKEQIRDHKYVENAGMAKQSKSSLMDGAKSLGAPKFHAALVSNL